MPYDSIAAAKKDGFPTSAEGISLTLAQINKLAEIYDAIKKAGTAKNPFAVAWTAWKKLYKKTDDTWTKIKTAAIQFGTEQFTAAVGKAEGIPDHAAMIEGELIHLNVKNLKKWGVTAKATDQIIAGIRGIPIRACMNPDPHACDYASNNFANVGYATSAKVVDGWIVAEAAITDREAAKKINDKTWMPFGKGNWSIAGFPSDPTPDFETSGLTNGFAPDAIALIIGNGKPAFEGSGFGLVAAAVNYNHRGDDMTEKKNEGGDDPVTYTQDALDKAVEAALEKQKTELKADANKHTTEELAKKKDASIAELTKQKAAHDAAIKKLSDDEKAAYEKKIADMTSKDDMKTILEAHAKQVQADTLDTIQRTKLMAEYKDVMQKSPVAGAPFITDGAFDQELFNAEMPTLEGMQTAALAGIVSKAKMVAAAVPGQNSFNEMQIPGTPPGSATSEEAELAICDRMG